MLCLLTTPSTEITVAVMQFTAKARKASEITVSGLEWGGRVQDHEVCGRQQQCRAAVMEWGISLLAAT